MRARFGNIDYAIGLQWSRIDSGDIKEEMQLISEEIGASWSVLRAVTREGGRVDRQAGFSSIREDAGRPSAAALLADRVDHVMLIEEVDVDQAWVCVVIDNEVLAGGDVIVPKREIEERLRNLLFGVLEEVDIPIVAEPALAAAAGISDAEPGSFASLINGAVPGKAHRVVRIGGSLRGPLMLGGLVLAGGFLTYTLLSGPSYDEELTVDFGNSLQTKVSEIVQPSGPSQAELLAAARAEEAGWLTEAFKTQQPSAVVSGLYRQLIESPRQLAGFTLRHLSWSYSAPREVEMSWIRALEGRVIELKGGLHSATGVTLSGDGSEAISTHPLKDAERRSIASIDDHLASHPLSVEILTDALSEHRYEWAISELEESPRPEPIKGIRDPALAVTRQLDIPARALQIKGKSLARFEALSGLFARQGQTLQLINVTIQAGQDTSWEIVGVIYEKP